MYLLLFHICIITILISPSEEHIKNRFVNIKAGRGHTHNLHYHIHPSDYPAHFPYITFLLRNEQVFCLGALIHMHYVMTTASCLLFNVPAYESFEVQTIGENHREELMITCKKFIIHPEYKILNTENGLATNNIGIVVLPKDILILAENLVRIHPSPPINGTQYCKFIVYNNLKHRTWTERMKHSMRIFTGIVSKSSNPTKDCQRFYGNLNSWKDLYCVQSSGSHGGYSFTDPLNGAVLWDITKGYSMGIISAYDKKHKRFRVANIILNDSWVNRFYYYSYVYNNKLKKTMGLLTNLSVKSYLDESLMKSSHHDLDSNLLIGLDDHDFLDTNNNDYFGHDVSFSSSNLDTKQLYINSTQIVSSTTTTYPISSPVLQPEFTLELNSTYDYDLFGEEKGSTSSPLKTSIFYNLSKDETISTSTLPHNSSMSYYNLYREKKGFTPTLFLRSSIYHSKFLRGRNFKGSKYINFFEPNTSISLANLSRDIVSKEIRFDESESRTRGEKIINNQLLNSKLDANLPKIDDRMFIHCGPFLHKSTYKIFHCIFISIIILFSLTLYSVWYVHVD